MPTKSSQLREVALPGRGTTFVRQCESEGPPGAPTLVLLHGLAATGSLNWSSSLAALRAVFPVVLVDHRGHGRGLAGASRFRLADCADDVAALADVLGLERFVPVGYSMGGPIAQLLWHRHPQRVAGVVLCATACTFVPRDRRRLASLLLPLLGAAGHVAPRRLLRGIALRRVAGSIRNQKQRARVLGELRGTDPVAVAQAAAAVGRFSSRDWIGDVDVPAAVVVTARDELVLPEHQRWMAAQLLDATVHDVDGDHLACVNQPQRFVPALVDACASVAQRLGFARTG